MSDLDAEVGNVIWVTSAYLLAYAVPLLVTGRLGDRIGPKTVYLTGLALFTVASVACGLTRSVEQLIVARVFQGFGAAMMTPQTMAVITRIFPAGNRGRAMSRLARLVRARRPAAAADADAFASVRPDRALVAHPHRSRLVVLAVFVLWQSRNRHEPLMPLSLFADRNFSLANLAIATIGFAITAMVFPLMLYAQSVRGFTPTRAALLLVPMAVLNAVLALGCFVVALVWLAAILDPDVPIWQLLLPIALLGVANGFMWAPIGSTATGNLPVHQAGAGSGVYNTNRHVGAVFGSASIAALMESRLAAAVLVVGLVAVVSFSRPHHLVPAARTPYTT